jgi:hypothetical protein
VIGKQILELQYHSSIAWVDFGLFHTCHRPSASVRSEQILELYYCSIVWVDFGLFYICHRPSVMSEQILKLYHCSIVWVDFGLVYICYQRYTVTICFLYMYKIIENQHILQLLPMQI